MRRCTFADHIKTVARALRRHCSLTTDHRAALKSHRGGAGIFRLDCFMQGLHCGRDFAGPAENMLHEIDFMNELRHHHAATRGLPLSPPGTSFLGRLRRLAIPGSPRRSFKFGESMKTAE